ncbi:MAG: NAD(P)/FAD-dependent oxidoreductase [Candidatus Omnitrophica bacterium]|nr:NAD(P)/FAD-dependent oxidoreductase [Candidatus Omnitrophota bacterium]
MEEVDVIIIGAGVVGLSIAARVADCRRSVFVLEKNDSFGRETSSRNSEVIHAGMYYEQGSLKAKMCVEGNRLLYQICSEHNIPHRKTGKLIVATRKDEETQLLKLEQKGKENNVPGLRMVSQKEVNKIEPNVKALSALYSPLTGIIDTHKLMEYFIYVLKEKGADISYGSEVIKINKIKEGYEVTVKDSSGDMFSFCSRVVINSAGLDSDKIAQMAGIDINKEKYNLKYCKGQYFRVANSQKCKLINRLIYPVPEMEKGGLGIHATMDLAGSVRLGPDTAYLTGNIINYDVDLSQKKKFFDSVSQFLPFLDEKDLVPDLAGIRPKLQGKGEPFRDFVIKEESELGYPGLINLIGIESPGLTAAVSIADYVKNLLR